ncbi:acyltransferase family protein [Pseudomonas vancouverensis]|uniref:Acyltransferase n=1 Tax=Pseudomonas vancouverensis TaxID=95300 RepID=A0A1H2PC48_PSEVA|nr:acyltransferase [Pseudomonas vancouverensis]KAB0493731.1 acyltransferase [Pseudomonas vancouverensis]TDB67692.1 acyltransferase [Pseudomonas vancouverensis]SDV15273.1 Peptidoglycan/LPS O-acetylase OafA/YrhL, contains acyltransferase and SGNH-hydrolase domains [Pseudomonas vancouverensis]
MSGDVQRQQNDKMWFLQFLRAVACLLIVYVHWLTFILNPGSVNEFVYQTKLPAYEASAGVITYATAVGKILPFDFREVYFGLALFFLISGFIIPVSLEKGSKVNYVVRRIARILPTAFVCTIITSLVMLAGIYVEGSSVAPFSVVAVLANALLVRDMLGQPFIDTAIWTLEIEVHFYIICFVISFFSGQKKAWVILSLPALFFLASLALTYSTGPYEIYRRYLNVIAINGSFLGVMFVGMALYNFSTGNWSVLKTAIMVFVLLVLNNLTLQNYASSTFTIIYANHVSAVLVFIRLMLLGDRVPYFKLMDKLAEISYPLYLLHGGCGYTIFYMVYKSTHNTSVSLFASFVAVSSLTYIVHWTIERPSTPVGKRVAGFFDRQAALRHKPDGAIA